MPTAPTINAGDGIPESAAVYSASSFVQPPAEYIFDIAVVPIGKPVIVPVINAEARPSDIPNTECKARRTKCGNTIPRPSKKISSVITANGNSEGITAFRQSDNPSPTSDFTRGASARRNTAVIAAAMQTGEDDGVNLRFISFCLRKVNIIHLYSRDGINIIRKALRQ